MAVEEKPSGINGIGRIWRIHGRKICKALGTGDRRCRRITSPEVLMRRLLRSTTCSNIPAYRVAVLEGLGIERGSFPSGSTRGAIGGLRRFFPLGLPIVLDTERAIFVYAESDHETAAALSS